MPIGEEGSDEFAHFRSVFDVIIKPAVEQLGYTVWRADDSPFTGNITKEVVEALSSSDLVIADLSNRNPNVYLELGIRHCLRKSGTIHLVEADQALPFDVGGYRAIKYSTDFDKIDGVKADIQAAINEKRRRPEKPDNPVHDSLDLPQDYRALAGDIQVGKLEAAQNDLAKTTRELELLRRRYEPDGRDDGGERIEPERLDEREMAGRLTSISKQVMENSLPGQLVVTAQQVAAEGKMTELVTVAQKLLFSPFADPVDLRTVARIAGRSGLEELELLVFEQTAAKFPGDSESSLAFAEACVHAADPTIQERGKRILEAHIGLVWEDAEPVIVKEVMPSEDIRAGVLLDFYSSSKRTAEELAVAKVVVAAFGETPVTLRSLARAYENAGQYDEAETFYAQAVEADPADSITLYWFGNFNQRIKNWSRAREFSVRACEADPDDARRVITLLKLCVAESKSEGDLAVAGERDPLRDLAVLAIKRGDGSLGVRSECAQVLNIVNRREVAQLCMDSKNWPSADELAEAEAVLDQLGAPPA